MVIALILSGGLGRRLNSPIPKQYVTVRGRMIVTYCLQALINHEKIDGIHIVAENAWWDEVLNELPDSDKLKGFSSPGETRQLSILNGLRDISKYAADDDVVFIQDAVRPLVSDELISRILDRVNGHDGVVPVLPMKDTLYLSDDGVKLSGRLERGKILAGQAPEAFLFKKYLSANEMLSGEEILSVSGSAEPALMAGLDVITVPGDEGNFKITTKTDMNRFIEIINERLG